MEAIECSVKKWRDYNKKNIISLETLDSLYQGRILERAKIQYGEPALYYPMLMQLTFLVYATPGILSIYQGSEYMEFSRMEDLPTPLQIEEMVGVFNNGVWKTKGSMHWFYEYSKKCLEIRNTLGFYDHNELELVFKDDTLQVLLFKMESIQGLRLLVLHASGDPIIESSYVNVWKFLKILKNS